MWSQVLIYFGAVLSQGVMAMNQPSKPQTIESFDFEEDQRGAVPQGWFVPRAVLEGYDAEVLGVDAHRGENCVRLFRHDSAADVPFGNMMLNLPAEELRGKRIRLRLALKAGINSRVQAWLRVDRSKRRMGFFDNMGQRPVRSLEWDLYEISGAVHYDAEQIALGVMLIDGDEGYVDSVELEVVGTVAKPTPAQKLSERGLANLRAFTQAYGLVRYYHPSPEVEAADWEVLLVQGMGSVEAALDAPQLARALGDAFAGVAPRVSFVPSEEQDQLPRDLPVPEGDNLECYQWTHSGVGFPGDRPNFYSSRRIVLKFPSEYRYPKGQARDSDAPVSDGRGSVLEGEVHIAALPGGVSCAVPLLWFPGPAAGQAVEAGASRPTASPAVFGAEDRAVRLSAVATTWNVFEHFYPYFDRVTVDWDLELAVALQSAALDADEAEFLDTLRFLVARLQDGHGWVSHAANSRMASLPLQWAWIDDQLVITELAEGTGAALTKGDAVLAIDGVPVPKRLEELESLISGATPQWIRLRAMRELAAGSPGNVTLEVERWGAREREELSLQRDYRPGYQQGTPQLDQVQELEPGTWYVDLTRVSDGEFERALPDLAEAQAVVFDFRGYPRGLQPQTFLPHLISDVAESAQWHVPVSSRPGEAHYGPHTNWTLQPDEPYLDAKRVFLIDASAISYSESCLGIIEHYALGDLVGGATAGTNGNVNPFEIPGGYRISWTGMKVLKQDGSPHHGVGILPTHPVARTRQGIAEDRDEVLEAALRILKE